MIIGKVKNLTTINGFEELIGGVSDNSFDCDLVEALLSFDMLDV